MNWKQKNIFFYIFKFLHVYGLDLLDIIIFNFHINTIEELWFLDCSIPYKDTNLCEIVRGAFLWTI
jgi:hypothetical protein